MPNYKLGAASLGRLGKVDLNLQKVVKRAIEITSQDFTITQSLRTREECAINYGKGRTAAQCVAKNVPAIYAQPALPKVTWLANPYASKHVEGKAVDLAPYPIDWNTLSKFEAIAVAMKQAAKELNIKITWGGDWVSSKDYPHFEV